MSRFIVLDHSLTGVGGHHYEQAVQMLRAAEGADLQPLVATNVRFAERAAFSSNWWVLPLFPDPSIDCREQYPLDIHGRPLGSGASTPSAGRPLDRPPSANLRRWWHRWLASPEEKRRKQLAHRLDRFATACGRLNRRLALRAGDHVFLPTASMFDLVGLARFVAGCPEAGQVAWHALFHYGLLSGRETEYANQASAIDRARQQLRYIADQFGAAHRNASRQTSPSQASETQNADTMPRRQLAGPSLHLYATTEKLCAQFNQLNVLPFAELPFPVNGQEFRLETAPRRHEPFRITSAGYLRREKGKSLATRFVRGIWDEYLATGKIQLVVQTNRRQARRMLPVHAEIPARFLRRIGRSGREPLVWLRHPLSRAEYIRVVRDTDVALFLHDAEAYYTRCSGVLIDTLACGIPVLVPAGSWLADQLYQPIYEHLAGMGERSPCVGERTLGTVGAVASSSFESPRIEVPPNSDGMLISFTGSPKLPLGTFVRLRATWSDEAGRPSGRACESIVDPRMSRERVATLLPIRQSAKFVRLGLSNAYDRADVRVRDVQLQFLGGSNDAVRPPAGKVGLIYANVDQLPDLLGDLHTHYDHYRRSAGEFAQSWRHWHCPERILNQMLSATRPSAGSGKAA